MANYGFTTSYVEVAKISKNITEWMAAHGDSTKKEASGYWLNGILLQGTQSDMFADLNEDGADTNAEHLPNAVAGEMADEDLDF